MCLIRGCVVFSRIATRARLWGGGSDLEVLWSWSTNIPRESLPVKGMKKIVFLAIESKRRKKNRAAHWAATAEVVKNERTWPRGRPPRATHRERGPVLPAHSHSASSSSRPAPRESGHPTVQRVAVEEGRSTSRGARRAGCSSDWLATGMRKHHLHIGWPSLACHWLPTQCRPDYIAVVRSLGSSQFDWHSPLLGPSLAVGNILSASPPFSLALSQVSLH